MITASALLLIVGTVLLVVGIFSSGTGLIFGSIIVTAAAGLLLFLGILADRKKPVAAPAGVDASTGESTVALESALKERPASTLGIRAGEDDDDDLIAEPETPVFRQETSDTEAFAPEEAGGPLAFDEDPGARPAARKKTAARKSPAKKPAARKAAAKKKTAAKAPAAGPSDRVVVVPGRDKFHLDSCRYASGAGAMTVTKAKARSQGYKSCGVCKP